MKNEVLKKYLLFAFCGIIIFLLSLLIFSSFSFSTKAENTENKAEIQEQQSSIDSEGQVTSSDNTIVNTYILREYKNSIGIFREGDALPFRVIAKDMRSLPELDRELLSQGIKVSGETDLKYLIQDYES